MYVCLSESQYECQEDGKEEKEDETKWTKDVPKTFCVCCAVLSVRGDTVCKLCQRKAQRSAPPPYTEHWHKARHLPDLHVLEDDDVWNDNSEVSKYAANTASFSYVKGVDDMIYDFSKTETLNEVDDALYLDYQWYARASEAEIRTDLQEASKEERQQILEAHHQRHAVPTPKTHAQPRKRQQRGETPLQRRSVFTRSSFTRQNSMSIILGARRMIFMN